MEIEGKEYGIGLICGLTDLLPCPHNCTNQRGFYCVLENYDGPLSIAYQCESCFICVIFEYSIEPIPPEDEKFFIKELAETDMKRLESQRGKRIEKNIFYNRVNWNNPDPFKDFHTPAPEIDSALIQDTNFWAQPYHAKTIGSFLNLQIYRKKKNYISLYTLLHVIVNNRFLILGIYIGDEIFIYYGRADLRDPESDETYHKMIDYVQKLPKPIFFFDYDFKLFGDGLKEEDYILFDQITGLTNITSYGMHKWEKELQKELGPNHFISKNMEIELTDQKIIFQQTIQAFELLLTIKRRILDEFILLTQDDISEEED